MPNSRLRSSSMDLIVDNHGRLIGAAGRHKNTYFPVILGASGVAASHTGSVDETELARCVIPGGILGAHGHLRLTTLWSVTGSVNDKTLRAKIGSSIDLLSAHLIATAATVAAMHDRVMFNRGNQNNQIVMSAPTGLGLGALIAAPDVGTENMAVDQTLIITGQLETLSETVTLQAWTLVAFPSD